MRSPSAGNRKREASRCHECGEIAFAYVLLYDQQTLSRKVCLACHRRLFPPVPLMRKTAEPTPHTLPDVSLEYSPLIQAYKR